MSVRVLSAELAAIRALVAGGLSEIGEAGDTGPAWLRSAAARLTAFETTLTEAAGVLTTPTRVVVLSVTTFVLVLGSTTLAAGLRLGAAGALVAAGATLSVLCAALPRAAPGLYTLIGRRRLAHVPLPRTPSVSPVSSPPLCPPPAPDSGLAGVPDRLLRARVRLVSAALRQVGADGWNAPELRRAIRADPVVRRLAHADQLLCQAVDCIERHLDDLRKEAL